MTATLRLYGLDKKTPLALFRDQLQESILNERPDWQVQNGNLVDDLFDSDVLVTPRRVISEISTRFRLPTDPEERKWVGSRILAWWATSNIQSALGAEPLGADAAGLAHASLGFNRSWRRKVAPDFRWPHDHEGKRELILPLAVETFIQDRSAPLALLRSLYHLGRCSFDTKADALRFLCLALTANVKTPWRQRPFFTFDTYKAFGEDFDSHQFVLSQFRASPAFALTLAIQHRWALRSYPDFEIGKTEAHTDRHYLESYIRAILRSFGLGGLNAVNYMSWEKTKEI